MKHANGFTLIELLVAMVIGSLLLASVSWIVSTLAREVQKDRDTRTARNLTGARPILASLFANALQDDIHQVEVKPDFIALDRPMPQAAGRGVGVLELKAEKMGKVARLVARVRGFGEARGSIGTPVLEGARDIRFEGIEGEGEDASRLQAVRMTVRSLDGKEDRLVFPLHVISDGSCVFDPISMACRPQ